ncbi:MAG: hypothetical protein JXQ81_12015 [Desulfuromonadales bacterium]|nr:hypothetical protein [Desulfuromonadales bacterium]
MSHCSLPQITKDQLFSSLPDRADDHALFQRIQAAVARARRKVVVLDDDPTGTQTVHGIEVLTGWDVENLKAALCSENSLFYILTNSRSLEAHQAWDLNQEIAHNLCQASQATGVDFDVISRSDSTLRGHYPGELDALEAVFVKETRLKFDGHLLIPAFFEGGRYTVNDIHYVQEGTLLTPAGQTEFAKDAVFGYHNSFLPAYVEEKTGGKVSANDVVSISIDDLRLGGPDLVNSKLIQVTDGRKIIVNAVDYRDMETFVLGLLQAEEAGKRFLVRSSASFVKSRGAITNRPHLTRDEIVPEVARDFGGLVVVGSYVGKTSQQIDAAKEIASLKIVEVHVQTLLKQETRADEIERVQNQVQQAILNGDDVMVYTSRKLIKSDSASENLNIGKQVSTALVEIVKNLTIAPRFLIAKGGITSSDLATDALGVKCAYVLGQVAAGISVWRLGEETKFPGRAYVVFPGNVGTQDTLADVIRLLQG